MAFRAKESTRSNKVTTELVWYIVSERSKRDTSFVITELTGGLRHSQVDSTEEMEQSKSIGKMRAGCGTNGRCRLARNLGAIVG